MPSTKQRINITVDRDTEWALKYLAKISAVPVATVAKKLLERGIEMQKKSVWTKISNERQRQIKK